MTAMEKVEYLTSQILVDAPIVPGEVSGMPIDGVQVNNS